MQNSLPQLSESQFITFLLIYAGHVDYDYSDEEINYIKAQDQHNDYEIMYNMFINMVDYSSLKTILKHKDIYLKTDLKKKSIYNKIIELFKIDGDYSRGEKTFLVFLDKLATPTNES